MLINSPRRISEVIDGTSNTFLMSEYAGRPIRFVKGKLVGSNVKEAAWSDFESTYTTEGWNGLPCHTNFDNDSEDYSFHPGGANKLFADGNISSYEPVVLRNPSIVNIPRFPISNNNYFIIFSILTMLLEISSR
jgi:prepilin-type processing-associated H-X9-DG protein